MSGRVVTVADSLRRRPPFDPVALQVVRVVRLDDGFVVEVPAFAALGSAQRLGPLGARRAHGAEGVPARDQYTVGPAGIEVGSAKLHRADAAAVLDRELAHHIAGQRRGEPFGTCTGLGHSVSLSPGSVVGQVMR
jgi:hypothetical protein